MADETPQASAPAPAAEPASPEASAGASGAGLERLLFAFVAEVVMYLGSPPRLQAIHDELVGLMHRLK